MGFLSLWRGSQSASSERTTSTDTSSSSSTSEASSTLSGQFSARSCEANLPAVSSLPETKQLVVKHAIQNLFEKNYFSICTLDNALAIVGARQGGEAYRMLHALHCMDYSKMNPELRARIPHLVNECLRQQDNVIEATEIALQGVAV